MSIHDQYQEAMASITMAVEERERVHEEEREQQDLRSRNPSPEPIDDALEPLEEKEGAPPAHWIFGSRRKGENGAMEMNSHAFGRYKASASRTYKNFDAQLREVVAAVCPEHGDRVYDHDFRLLVRLILVPSLG